MTSALRTTSAAIGVAATAGLSSVLVGVAPAHAAAGDACGPDGTLIATGVCEQVFTSGTATFTATPQMTKLEALLVGAGGAGANQPTGSTSGYAAGGGGGEVKVVDLSGSNGPLAVVVPTAAVPGITPGGAGSITGGVAPATVANGLPAADNSQVGGASGNGNAGASGNGTFGGGGTEPYGAGGGAGAPASAAARANGGAGATVSSLAPAGSLFSGDTDCFGGGGAIGTAGGVVGTPGCGGGGPADATGTLLLAPTANSGGGGGGLTTTQAAPARAGANGRIVLRWSATVTLSFAADGHGTAPASQILPAGATPTRPADPTAEGFEFQGWFTDPQLTAPADFSAPLRGSATFYAKWVSALAPTGIDAGPIPLMTAGGLLLSGIALLVVSRRKRREG